MQPLEESTLSPQELIEGFPSVFVEVGHLLCDHVGYSALLTR